MIGREIMSLEKIADVLHRRALEIENGTPRAEVPVGHPERGIVERAMADLAAHVAGNVVGISDCGNPDAPIDYRLG